MNLTRQDMDKIALIPITPDVLRRPEVQKSERLTEVCRSTIAMYGSSGSVEPWTGYLAEIDGHAVGTCAFKGEPQGGRVEIVYFTFPEHDGEGVATAMAGELVKLARASGIRDIVAHTIPEQTASTQVLKKLGFDLEGVAEHPNDGLVWEWKHNPRSMRGTYARRGNWVALVLASVAALLLVIQTLSGESTRWHSWAFVLLLIFNVGVLGLARERFAPRTLLILTLISAAAALFLLVALAVSMAS